MTHTNEEMREKLFKLWKELRLEDKTSFEEIPAVIQIENFINQEISDLKKSIREEIGIKRLPEKQGIIIMNYSDKLGAYSTIGEIQHFNQALDDILSLKSLE